jgi:hypothetical protein
VGDGIELSARLSRRIEIVADTLGGNRMRQSLPILIVLLALTGGCATAPPVETPAKPVLPEPANFQISGTLTANLTPQLMLETGLPQTVKGTLQADAHSEAVAAEPLHSHHQGRMKLTVTDDQGKQSLLDVDINVSGDSAGSPTEGLGQAISRFLDAASMMARPMAHPSASAPKGN